ncbi:MAG: hypothetical protein QF464_00425, partial [Myxococcota bacterium]|nr:hypothetical protein [Myxococcota bacterium]
MKVSRPEWLLCAVLSGVLGWSSPIYFPTAAAVATVIRSVLWIWAVACVVLAIRARAPAEPPRLWVRVVSVPTKLFMGLCLATALGMLHRSSYFTALVLSQPLAVTAAVLEGGGLALCAWVAWRRPDARRWTVAVSAALLFVGSIQYVPMAAWLWSPAGPDSCDEVLRAGEVERLSPAAWAAEPSQPFSLLYIPEEGLLLGAFKMGGNGSFGIWNDPASNRLMGLDIRHPEAVGDVVLGEMMTVMHIAYRPDTREALVARQGASSSLLNLVSLEGFPQMKVVRTVEFPGAPPVLVLPPRDATYAVVNERGFVRVRDHDRLEETDRLSLGLSDPEAHRPTDRVPIWAWSAPGSRTFYINVLLHPLVEIDL